MKGVIPAAGKGKRLEPLTLSIPKEMIRVGTKPVIEHVINNLQVCGINEILVITGWKKGAVLDYLGSGRRLGVNIYYRVQDEEKGTADAINLTREWVEDEDFIVIYGDNYFKPADSIKEAVKFHEEKKPCATLLVHAVEDPTHFGIVKMDSEGKVISMIEKPTLEEAEKYKMDGKYYCIAGMLILSPEIFKYIEKTKVGRKGELWLTDAIELMRQDGKPVYGHIFDGVRYDIGSMESLKIADEQALSEEK